MSTLKCTDSYKSFHMEDDDQFILHNQHRGCRCSSDVMGLLPDKQNCGLRMRLNVGDVFPAPTSKETACWRSQHASRHVRHARTVKYVRIVTPRWPRRGHPGISGACAIRKFAYLVRGPWVKASSAIITTWRGITCRTGVIIITINYFRDKIIDHRYVTVTGAVEYQNLY